MNASINHPFQLKESLVKRYGFVKQVGELKKKHWKPSFDQVQWDKVKAWVKEQAKKYSFREVLIDEVWDEIHEIAIKIEDIIPEVPENDRIDDETLYIQEITPLRESITELNDSILMSINWILTQENWEDAMGIIKRAIREAGKDYLK